MTGFKALLVTTTITGLALIFGCQSEPQNPYPQGYPQQGYPGQAPGFQQPGQQPMQPMQPVQPVQPVVPGQPAAPAGQQPNPLVGLAGALGQAMGQAPGQAAGGAPAQMIPWQSLSQALPTAALGWALKGEIEGESANMMGISVSTAKCKLAQGGMEATIEIVDTSMNPMIAMPFNMMRSMQIDSSKERRGPVNFGTYPGTQSWTKTNNNAEVMVMVHNRVMITVKVTNAASEAPANQLASQVNYAHIASLIGG